MDSLTLLKKAAPLIPVIVLSNADHAIPLAQAVMEGGFFTLEITLRTPSALEAIKRIKNRFPECVVGAGTVINTEQFDKAVIAGSDFIVSPGITDELVTHAARHKTPYIPGVCSSSDIMLAISHGLNTLKFFPAEQAGGVPMLKAFSGPFKKIFFCPTGGITRQNQKHYLALDNVCCTGGAWCVPKKLIESGNWKEITHLVKQAKNPF